MMDGGAMWRQFVDWLTKPKEQYGAPGRRLTNLTSDHEDAGADLANRFDQTYGKLDQGLFDAKGAREREAARHRLSKELHDTWRQGELYSPWVAKAARKLGL